MKRIVLILLSIFITISATFFTSCGTNKISSQVSAQKNKTEKYENKELKSFVQDEDNLIKQEEGVYSQLLQAMQNKSKIDTYEKTNYRYNVVAEKLGQLNDSAKSKKFYDLVKLHINETRAYSYDMSKTVMYIALKGNHNWVLSENMENQLQNAIKSVQDSKDVYYLSKDRMLKKVIYQKDK